MCRCVYVLVPWLVRSDAGRFYSQSDRDSITLVDDC